MHDLILCMYVVHIVSCSLKLRYAAYKMASGIQACARCSDNFIVNTKNISCDFCKKLFHHHCAEVDDKLAKVKRDCAGIKWFCSGCLPMINGKLKMADFGEAVFNRIPEKSEVKMVSGSRASRSSASVPESDLAVLEKEIECLVREKNLIDKIANERGYIVEIQKKLISDLEDKFRSQPVGNSSKNKDCVSYSAIVKKMDHSYLLIKPADRSTSYKTVENDFKSRYSPGALNVNINKTKLTKNGLMISCNSKKDVETLKDSLKSDLGNKFDVCEPTKMFPNDCFKNPGPDKLEFVDSFVDDLIFNNNLGVNSDDIKIISCYKVKNTKNVVIEVVPSVFNLLSSKGGARVAVGETTVTSAAAAGAVLEGSLLAPRPEGCPTPYHENDFSPVHRGYQNRETTCVTNSYRESSTCALAVLPCVNLLLTDNYYS
ncbi:unnamed protein product [Acanthoscelides obtectus]|uniref:PHD-type domain-containing protein n=1 Tax=Acanthoscelides obtectus TaxID=200917 RepID=A0A9P0KRC5_ACAOB|nr:unnamed protein product [Acanthoscelides obtectus]CAK1651937.1 hypothetical protein AOBTE_LOCUS17559 [Acanthoscelides obtectus]